MPRAVGAGQAITVLRRIRTGLFLISSDLSIVFSKFSRSTSPSALAATSKTSQPYDRYRAETSSVNATWVSPSIDIRLSS